MVCPLRWEHGRVDIPYRSLSPWWVVPTLLGIVHGLAGSLARRRAENPPIRAGAGKGDSPPVALGGAAGGGGAALGQRLRPAVGHLALGAAQPPGRPTATDLVGRPAAHRPHHAVVAGLQPHRRLAGRSAPADFEAATDRPARAFGRQGLCPGRTVVLGGLQDGGPQPGHGPGPLRRLGAIRLRLLVRRLPRLDPQRLRSAVPRRLRLVQQFAGGGLADRLRSPRVWFPTRPGRSTRRPAVGTSPARSAAAPGGPRSSTASSSSPTTR